MAKDKRRGTAYHEAGHAVVAWEVCCQVIAIHIDGGGETGGTDTHCDYRRMSFIDRIALCCGGEVAQAMFDAQTHAAAAADRNLLDTLLHGLSEDIREELRDAGKLRAQKVLEQYSRNIERVASYLMTHDKVDEGTFIHLFLGSEPAPL